MKEAKVKEEKVKEAKAVAVKLDSGRSSSRFCCSSQPHCNQELHACQMHRVEST